MASTSTSSVQKRFKYDVFLSFRGEDTRNNFVSHLYKALEQQGIETYKGDEKISKGKTISDELIEAIEDSRFYIVVFSKNYASSSWCLKELVKIMECQKMKEHTAYPVFYDVEPTEVRKLYGLVGEAFKKHETEESAGKWREALKEAAALAGWELNTTDNGHEANFIQKIIQEISLELRYINSSVDENLVGMDTRVNEVLSSLELGVDDVHMIGIKGMGGAGKTTLARAVFDKISFQFEGQSFVENVREESKPSLSGLKSLQKQLLSDVLNDQGITVSGVREGKKMIERKMRVRKVLIVLDDVDKIEQLEALVTDCYWFKPGSRIIITTRNEQVLVAHNGCLIHNVNLLSTEEAICLFSRYAFGKEVPVPGYEELSRLVVCYAAGLPLTIRVLGSLLCGKNDLDWKDAIERLKTIPLKETLSKLELSYMGLEEDYKEIFLDVACLLKGWSTDDAVIALESCGFCARIGLRVLELKSLITISKYGVLGMHDHLEEMGKNIVRRVNPNKPEMHSRLWIREEIEEILTNDSGTQPATRCLKLDEYDGLNFEISTKGLANMKELRFLHVGGIFVSKDQDSSWSVDYKYEVSNWSFDEDDLHLPNALRFLRWRHYPFSSLPKTFHANNLVGLVMDSSRMVKLWKYGEEKTFPKLRFLKFTNLNCRLRTVDLSVALYLETLILGQCWNLVEVDFQVAPNLKELRIYECRRLEKLHMPAKSPKLINLSDSTDMVEVRLPAECPNLESLNLRDCGRFESFEFEKKLDSTEVVSFSELHLIAYAYDAYDAYDTNDTNETNETNDTNDTDDTRISDPGNTWPKFMFSCDYKGDPASSFGNLERLISLGFGDRINVDSFSDIICGLQYLRKLTLEGVIRNVPKNLDQLDCLEELIFSSTKMGNLPDSICKMKHLKSLELKSCLLLKKLPEDLGQIESLETITITNCNRLRDIPNNMGKIKCVISPKVYKRFTHGKFKQRPINDAVDNPHEPIHN